MGDAAEGYPAGNIAACPVCCWAGQGVTVSVGGKDYIHPGVQFLLDFCFKVDIPHPNQRYYVTQAVAGQALPEEMAAAAAELGAAAGPPATDHGCSDHTAAEESGQLRLAVSGALPSALCSGGLALRLTSAPLMQRDITALGAILCRHGLLMAMMDIKTGERYIYGILLLCHLMFNSLPDGDILPVKVLWYDINCRFAPYMRRWAEKLPQPMKEAVLRVLTPLPSFHKYAHR